jgi:spore germination cell wall hydrolase CwlJ-like protein
MSSVVIVSFGLIAGYQGLDYVVPEYDPIVTASIGSDSQADGPRKIVDPSRPVIDFAEDEVMEPAATPEKASENRPVVNRAAKTDRIVDAEKFARSFESHEYDPIAVLQKLLETEEAVEEPVTAAKADRLSVSEEVDVASGVKTAPKEARDPVTAAPVRDSLLDHSYALPYADRAEMAIYAADMPLPAKLKAYRSNSRTHQRPAVFPRSPLVPRKYSSGKAFGGLSENEFQKRERRCMATALYFEARSEPEKGQYAVGQVIMNRVRSPDYPDTICGVVYQGSHRRTGCQFSFTCDGKADRPSNKRMWSRSIRLANRVLEGRIWLRDIGHSTHYHATYVAPVWRKKMRRLTRIGHHIFYAAPEVSVTDTYQRVRGAKS